MVYHLAAVAVLGVHLAFILFVLLGAALALRWRWLPWLHLPAATWGVWVELGDRVCPLTWLENALLVQGGQAGYSGGCIEHHLVALIYPEGLTRGMQIGLAVLVLAVNAGLYGGLARRAWRRRRRAA
jgi:hypothetical protein